MYHVALLIERALQPLDVDQLIELHAGLDEPVTYHVLLPVESSTALLASSMSALGAGQVMPLGEPDVIAEVQSELRQSGKAELDSTAQLFRERGMAVTADLTEADPIDALGELVTTHAASEAIILTEPHVVREFLHLDWTSRARRHLDVPTLHLVEHLPFAAQQ